MNDRLRRLLGLQTLELGQSGAPGPGQRRLKETSMKRSVSVIIFLGYLAGAAAVAHAAGQTAASTPDEVKRIIESRCAGCHKGKKPPKGLSLEEASLSATVVGVPSRERPDLQLVNPGNPDASYLLLKIRGAEGIKGRRMPPGKPLAEEDIAGLAEWIRSLPPAV
jgi:mono/diheme cytochrome c family protein